MFIYVKDGVPGKKIRSFKNVKSQSGRTYSDLRLVDAADLAADGIYKYVDAGSVPKGQILNSETLTVGAGVVTRAITFVDAPVQVEPPISSGEEAVHIMQEHLDETAQAYGYDSIYTASTYADEPADPQFQLEGKAFRKWRSKFWRAGNDLITQYADLLNPPEVAPDAPIVEPDPNAPAAPTKKELLAMLPTFSIG